MEGKSTERFKKAKKMMRIAGSALVVLSICALISALLFPAGNTLTPQQVSQRSSNHKLSTFVKIKLQSKNIGKPENSELADDSDAINSFNLKFQNFLMFTNAAITINIFGTNNSIVAHERLGLWSDNTIAAFFSEAGVIRLPQGVFCDIITLDGESNAKLKFIKSPNIWKIEME